VKKISLLSAAFVASLHLLNLPVAAFAGENSKEVTVAPPEEKAPPLPLHTIEGVGGLVITPVAYLVNPGAKGTILGLPSFSTTYVKANQKNIEAFGVSETLFGRLELSYSPSRFGLGTLGNSIHSATGIQLNRSDVFLHNFNARALLLPENSFGLSFLPAVTAGAQFKINDGIASINDQLGRALSSIGYEHKNGVDFTLTATKAFPNVFNRTLLISTGLRVSKASQLGYVGFGDTYRPTFEGNIAYSLTPRLWLAGEYRQKANPYDRIGNLVRPERSWWTTGLAFIVNNHATVTAGYGHFGNVLDTYENKGFALQVKYEL
jgi:hypothetical protein